MNQKRPRHTRPTLVPVALSLDEATLRDLKQEAARRGMSLSALVRDIVDTVLLRARRRLN